MSDDNSDKEIDATIAGQHVRAKGYRLIDLIWLPLVAGVGYTVITLYNHEASAQAEKKVLSETLKESNKSVSEALKEQNAIFLQAIKDLTAEQKKATVQITIGNCMNSPAMRNRNDAREECRRIVRDDR